jgi:hypothetical protein
MIRQRVYQMASGYEDCIDADNLRIDPAMRLALGKGHQFGASLSVMSRLENDILGTTAERQALDTISVGAPLPGCSWLAVLRVHALRNGLQRSGKRGIFKTHEKVGFKQVLERSDGILGFAKTNIRFEEREFDRKLANRHAELVFWKKCRIIQNYVKGG